MFTAYVVEAVYIFEEGAPGVAANLPVVPPDHFGQSNRNGLEIDPSLVGYTRAEMFVCAKFAACVEPCGDGCDQPMPIVENMLRLTQFIPTRGEGMSRALDAGDVEDVVAGG